MVHWFFRFTLIVPESELHEQSVTSYFKFHFGSFVLARSWSDVKSYLVRVSHAFYGFPLYLFCIHNCFDFFSGKYRTSNFLFICRAQFSHYNLSSIRFSMDAIARIDETVTRRGTVDLIKPFDVDILVSTRDSPASPVEFSSTPLSRRSEKTHVSLELSVSSIDCLVSLDVYLKIMHLVDRLMAQFSLTSAEISGLRKHSVISSRKAHNKNSSSNHFSAKRSHPRFNQSSPHKLKEFSVAMFSHSILLELFLF